jgi:cyclophilin family peptidyl-prolyl cis-trans isomerase
MRFTRYTLACWIGMASAAFAQSVEQGTVPLQASEAAVRPTVIIETSLGAIQAELFVDKAPLTVANFLAYMNQGAYDGTIFHRVISGYMIQGGGFTPDMKQKPPNGPVKNEARSDVPNRRGTLAMARTPVIDSATSQFFINLQNNDNLDHIDNTGPGYGYAVFGRVTAGMDVVDKIAEVFTHSHPSGHKNVPIKPVLILSVKRAPAAE